jgi:hypothetical protein
MKLARRGIVAINNRQRSSHFIGRFLIGFPPSGKTQVPAAINPTHKRLNANSDIVARTVGVRPEWRDRRLRHASFTAFCIGTAKDVARPR